MYHQQSAFDEGDGVFSNHFKNAREEADELTSIFEAKIQKIIANTWKNRLQTRKKSGN